MKPNREYSRPAAVFHTNIAVVMKNDYENTGFACMPVDPTNPLTEYKIITKGEHIISAANLRRVANDILRMLGEGW
tara:strand:+ start:317 stop:544 length:228 start_codon:yes stop_codon:yes gene_type:complete